MKPALKERGAMNQSNPFMIGRDRRQHRRHDFDQQGVSVQRWDAQKLAAKPLGKILDISAGGVRFQTSDGNVRPDQQIRVRLELPTYAGISPFIAPSTMGLEPKPDWVGWI